MCSIRTVPEALETYIRIEVISAKAGLSEEYMTIFDDRNRCLYQPDSSTESNIDKMLIHISKEVMHLHGGRLGAYSPGIDEGSVLYMDIPYKSRNSQTSQGSTNNLTSPVAKGSDALSQSRSCEDSGSRSDLARGSDSASNDENSGDAEKGELGRKLNIATFAYKETGKESSSPNREVDDLHDIFF